MTASMTGHNSLHFCPSPECAARNHQPIPYYQAAINPGVPFFQPTYNPPVEPMGMFWTPAQLAALMNEVRKTERATVLAELELLKDSNDV